MEQMNQNEKSLVFSATQAHALAVRDLINQRVADQRNLVMLAVILAMSNLFGLDDVRGYSCDPFQRKLAFTTMNAKNRAATTTLAMIDCRFMAPSSMRPSLRST